MKPGGAKPGGAKGAGRAGGAGPSSGGGKARFDAPPPETLFLATVPGATPSKWVDRFTSRERVVQLVNHDEHQQAWHLQHDEHGFPLHPLPQLGYVRWRRDRAVEDVLREAGVDPRRVHVVRAYSELPVVCVGKEHLLAAWDVEADGPVPWSELDPAEAMDPARFALEPPAPDAFVRENVESPGAFVRENVDSSDGGATAGITGPPAAQGDTPAPVLNPLDAPETPGTGERMALEIVASGAGHVVLPQSVARMFGRKDVVVLPLASSLDEVVGISRAEREAMAMAAELAAEEAGMEPQRADELFGVTGEHAPDDARHPGWDVGLAWLKESDSELVQAFVGVSRGRRSGSSR